MTTNERIGHDDDADDGLSFSRGRYRLMAVVLIVFALAGAVGCVVADVL
jgi:hypothetical protein